MSLKKNMEAENSAYPLLTFGEIFQNYQVTSDFLYALVKSESQNEKEAWAKFHARNQMMSKIGFYGYSAQILFFGSFVAYCLKGYSKIGKIFAGFLFTQWNHHVYTIAANLGILLGLPSVMQELHIENGNEAYQLNRDLHFFINLVRSPNRERDSKLMEQYYKYKMADQKQAEEVFSKSYLSNNYFSKNFDRYKKESSDDSTPHHVFEESKYYQDELKVPFLPDSLDLWLFRYIYNNSKRWITKVGWATGFLQEK